MLENQFLKFWKKEIKVVQKVIHEGKTLALVGIYGIGYSLLPEIIKEKTSQEKPIFVDLKDLPSPTLSDIYKIVLKKLNKNKSLKIPQSDFEFHYLLREILQENPSLKFHFIFYEAQNLLSFPDSFFDAIESLRYYFEPRISIILFGQPELYNSPTPGLKRLIKNNYLFLTPFDKKTALADIKMQEKRLKKKFSNLSNFICKYSRGHHGAIKFICQQIKNFNPKIYNKKTFSGFIKKEALMNLWFDYVFKSLSTNQKMLIWEFLTKGNLSKASLKTFDFEILKRLGFFKKSGQKISFLFSSFKNPVIKYFRKKSFRKNKLIKIKNNQIYIKNLPVIEIFNYQEEELLKAFIENKGKVLSFEEIGQILWKKAHEEKFSLWAINKLISRIRNKLLSYNLPKKTIKTIRKSGYYLSI